MRYVKNNFLDGNRQDAYDLFLQYEVNALGAYPLVDKRPLQIKALPVVLLVSAAMLVAAIIVPEGKEIHSGLANRKGDFFFFFCGLLPHF